MTGDEMVGWCHRLNGHEFEQTLGDGERQGSLACCRPRGHKESDTTYRLDNGNNNSRVQAARTKRRQLPMCYTVGDRGIQRNVMCGPALWQSK